MTKGLVIALDDLSLEEIMSLVNKTTNRNIWWKINDAFAKYGTELVKQLGSSGCKIFLDCKWHDIPNTVANYVKFASEINNLSAFTIHCAGGYEMMKTAVDTLNNCCKDRPRPVILGITVLTSLNDKTLKENLLYHDTTLNELVVHYAKLAQKAGLDGVVCSPHEISIVKAACGSDFITVTPGIRPEWAQDSNDQKRVMTPSGAALLGTDYIVVGRPIIQAEKYGLTVNEAIEKIQTDLV